MAWSTIRSGMTGTNKEIGIILFAISNSSNSGGLSLTQSLSHVTQKDLWIRRSFITLRLKDFWIKYYLTRLTSGPLGPPTLKNDFLEVSNLVNNNFREILTLRI